MFSVALAKQLCLAMMWLMVGSCLLAADQPANGRIVFLGDSITDGNTYPLLVEQALVDAGLPAPRLINAGIGGDTSAGMLKRLDRDVFPHRPTLVFVSAGINDQFAPDEYRNHITRIVDLIRQHGIGVALLTTSIVRNDDAKVQQKLDDYNRCLREITEERQLALGDVNRLMKKIPDAPRVLLVEDGVHPNFQGQRVIARAVLDALGNTEVPVPEVLRVALMPGVIKSWNMRPADSNEPALAPELAGTLTPATCKRVVELPLSGDGDTANWTEQESGRGFAMELDKHVGKSDRFFGVATFHSDGPREVILSTGGGLKAVVLNGEVVYRNVQWAGWHAGREQVRVALVRGENRIAIECGTNFFLSLTGPE